MNLTLWRCESLLREFFDREISRRLITILATTAANILQRFAFDNVCNFALGYDLGQLLPSSGPDQGKFAVAFDDDARLSFERFFLIVVQL